MNKRIIAIAFAVLGIASAVAWISMNNLDVVLVHTRTWTDLV